MAPLVRTGNLDDILLTLRRFANATRLGILPIYLIHEGTRSNMERVFTIRAFHRQAALFLRWVTLLQHIPAVHLLCVISDMARLRCEMAKKSKPCGVDHVM